VALMAIPGMMVVGWRRGACVGLMLACWPVAHILILGRGAVFRLIANWAAVNGCSLGRVCRGGENLLIIQTLEVECKNLVCQKLGIA